VKTLNFVVNQYISETEPAIDFLPVGHCLPKYWNMPEKRNHCYVGKAGASKNFGSMMSAP